MRTLIERLEDLVEKAKAEGEDEAFNTPSDMFIGFIAGTSKPGSPGALDRFKTTAKEYGVKVLKVVAYPPYGDQIHVKLPNGKYGFFTPGGPKADRSYQWTPAAASNYKPDSDFMKGR